MGDSGADSAGALEVCMSVHLGLSFCGDIDLFAQPHLWGQKLIPECKSLTFFRENTLFYFRIRLQTG